MTSHARVTVQITTGFHSWSVFLEARAFIFPSKRHTIVATIGTDVHLEKNRLKEIRVERKMTTTLAVCGVIGSAHNVYSYILPGFQKAYWIVSLYADTPFKPKTKLKYVFTLLKENSISWKMLSEFFRPNHVIHLMEIKYFISQYFFTYIWFGTMILSMLSYWNSTYVLSQNKKEFRGSFTHM